MKIRHKVRIKWDVAYLVVWVDKFDDPDCLGLCDEKARTIYLKKGMSKQLTRTTFMHELLHALEFTYNIKIPHNTIYELSPVLIRLFALNKSLIKELGLE